MDSSNIAAGTGLMIMLIALVTLFLGVRSNTRKNQKQIADDLETKFQNGIAEGLRRAEPQLSELRSELRLMTSERDQARSDLGELRNEHRPRGGRA